MNQVKQISKNLLLLENLTNDRILQREIYPLIVLSQGESAMLIPEDEKCWLCDILLAVGESIVMWENLDGNQLISHARCYHKYNILTENYKYTQAEARKMLLQRILVFTGGD